MTGANMHLVTVDVQLKEGDKDPEQHLDEVSLVLLGGAQSRVWLTRQGGTHCQESRTRCRPVQGSCRHVLTMRELSS